MPLDDDEAEALALCVVQCVIGMVPPTQQREVRRRVARALFAHNDDERTRPAVEPPPRRSPRDPR